MSDDFELDSYRDTCAICGVEQEFRREKYAIRETYHCAQCRGSLREREHARVIVSHYGRGRVSSLEELVGQPEFSCLRIYEPGTTGAIRKYIRNFSGYHQSDFYPEDVCKQEGLAPPHQNLESLTYEDDSFDLILHSDILEHVRHPGMAISEAYRVLRRGGVNCFTVPLQDPLPEKSRPRVDTSGDEDVNILPPHYHGNGKGGKSLVYMDFGKDIEDMLRAAGFVAGVIRSSASSSFARKVFTVFALKL